MNIYKQLYLSFKSSYMMMIPLSIIFQSCLGSIAAMYILMASDTSSPDYLWQLGACVSICMIYNAAILAQLQVKWVFNLLVASIFLNVSFLVFNFI